MCYATSSRANLIRLLVSRFVRTCFSIITIRISLVRSGVRVYKLGTTQPIHLCKKKIINQSKTISDYAALATRFNMLKLSEMMVVDGEER